MLIVPFIAAQPPSRLTNGAASPTITGNVTRSNITRSIHLAHVRLSPKGVIMVIYRTREWNGHGKQKYWNEYRREGDNVVKYRCNRHKFFDGDESNWEEGESEEESWAIDDPSMPNWLRNYL